MNRNGNNWESNLDGEDGYDRYEKYFNGQKWWEEMKIRRKNKSEKQKDLDRSLIEKIGYSFGINGQKSKSDFEKIKILVEKAPRLTTGWSTVMFIDSMRFSY